MQGAELTDHQMHVLQGVCASMTVAGVGSLAPPSPRACIASATSDENSLHVGKVGDNCVQTHR